MVSVPCTTTMPSTPSANRSPMTPASAVRSSNPSEAPGSRRKSWVCTAMSESARPGTAASSWSAESAGATPPAAAAVIAIVPPRLMTRTRRGLASDTAVPYLRSGSRRVIGSLAARGVQLAEVPAGPVHARGGQQPAAGFGEAGAAVLAEFGAPARQPRPVQLQVGGQRPHPPPWAVAGDGGVGAGVPGDVVVAADRGPVGGHADVPDAVRVDPVGHDRSPSGVEDEALHGGVLRVGADLDTDCEGLHQRGGEQHQSPLGAGRGGDRFRRDAEPPA